MTQTPEDIAREIAKRAMFSHDLYEVNEEARAHLAPLIAAALRSYADEKLEAAMSVARSYESSAPHDSAYAGGARSAADTIMEGIRSLKSDSPVTR